MCVCVLFSCVCVCVCVCKRERYIVRNGHSVFRLSESKKKFICMCTCVFVVDFKCVLVELLHCFFQYIFYLICFLSSSFPFAACLFVCDLILTISHTLSLALCMNVCVCLCVIIYLLLILNNPSHKSNYSFFS